MQGGWPRFLPFAGPLAAGLQHDWHELRADSAAWPDAPVPATATCIEDTLPGVQREYGRIVSERAHDALLLKCAPMDAARLRSCACRTASMWLDAVPTAHALVLTDSDFVYAARYRMGAPYLPTDHPPVTCWCGIALSPGNPDHAVHCNTASGSMTLRHNLLLEIWRRIFSRAGLATSAEPCMAPLRRADDHGAQGDRGDILLSLAGQLTVADVSVICPTAQSYLPRAAVETGSAAATRDKAKRRKYKPTSGGYAFVPISVETHGRIGTPAMDLLGKVAAQAGLREERGKATFVTNALRELSVGLCKGNAILFRAGLQILARCSGRHFVAGVDRPHAEID